MLLSVAYIIYHVTINGLCVIVIIDVKRKAIGKPVLKDASN